MKTIVLVMIMLATVTAVQAQTIPLNPTAPVRSGDQGQTAVPPLNPGLNQSTIQGPPEVQRTLTNRDAQATQLDPEAGFAPASTPENSPTTVPDVREQPLIRQQPRRESTDVVPSRDRNSRSSKTPY